MTPNVFTELADRIKYGGRGGGGGHGTNFKTKLLVHKWSQLVALTSLTLTEKNPATVNQDYGDQTKSNVFKQCFHRNDLWSHYPKCQSH